MAINRAYHSPGFNVFDEKDLSQTKVLKYAVCSSKSLGAVCAGNGTGISCNAQIGIFCTGKGTVGITCQNSAYGITCASGNVSFSCENSAQSTPDSDSKELEKTSTTKK